MIRNEFLRFMQIIKDKDTSIGVHKLANLILEHLGDIQPLGTAQGRRIKKIVALTQSHWQTTSEEITITPNESNDIAKSIFRLKNMSVGPFRGFSRVESFDLDSLLVLIYGPNGTGKSSFCEALEYGLLGSVEEAASKRFSNQEGYLENAYVSRFEAPTITATYSDGEERLLSANEELFRFSFVEKNRIDNFSRIAAHAPVKQTALISTLFGLDSFNDFVRGFSSDIDERYLDVVGKKNLELQAKRKRLDVHFATIETESEVLDNITKAEAALASEFQKGISFSELVVSLGTPNSPGLIQELETALQQQQPHITNLTEKQLNDSIESVKSVIRRLDEKTKSLAKASLGLSFKQLYSAISELQGDRDEHCPACKTPLSQVENNPFELATEELAKLDHLSQLELEHDHLKT